MTALKLVAKGICHWTEPNIDTLPDPLFHRFVLHLFPSPFRPMFPSMRKLIVQLQLITDAAMRCGFSGGVVVDYPNSAKAKKYFLVIDAGVDQAARLAPKALGCEDDDSMGAAGGAGRGGRGGGFHHGTVQHEDRRRGGGGGKDNRRGKGKRSAVKSRDWVKAKKERARKQGKATKRDSKYSARRRPAPF